MSDEFNTADGVAGLTAAKDLPPPELVNGKRECSIEEIRSTLPHRGILLCLDRVIILRQKVIGVLEVNPDRCVGFCFLRDEELVLMGTFLIEMAIQLLGIYGAQFGELRRLKRRFVSAETGRTVFLRPVRAGETITMEVDVSKIRVRRGSEKSQRHLIEGEEFVAKVGDEVMARIFGVKIVSTIAPISKV